MSEAGGETAAKRPKMDREEACGDAEKCRSSETPRWRAAPMMPRPTSQPPPPLPCDEHVEKLRAENHPCWLLAYMRDLTRVMEPAVKSTNIETFPRFVGRAFAVSGPDIYLSALEGIPPGSVYVQGGCDRRAAVFSPGWTHAYVKPRGGVAVVVDGGVYKSFQCQSAAVPLFASFATPAIGINRREGRCNEDVVCAGVTVGSGDIVCGDADGVVIIPKAHEEEFFAKLDTFVRCNGCFGRVAAQAMEKGTPLTEHPALSDMFERKYANPEAYWREYESWWEQWRNHPSCLGAEETTQLTPAFYSK